MDKGVADLLFSIRTRGVKVWTERGELKYHAKKGAITFQDREYLKKYRSELVALLETRNQDLGGSLKLAPRGATSGPAPVTPVQQSRLKWLHSNYSTCRLMPLRLSGNLDVVALRTTFRALAERHEALRTQFVKIGEEFWQQVRQPSETDLLSTRNLIGLCSADQEAEVVRIVTQAVEKRIDQATEPLFLGTILTLQKSEHLLFIHIHDGITDATSAQILWRDLWTIYVCVLRGTPAALPKIQIQQADFAIWIKDTEASWKQQHGEYWRTRLRDADQIRLFSPKAYSYSVLGLLGILSLKFDLAITRNLQNLGRRERSSLGMVILATWSALISRWCDRRELVIRFMTSGRMHSEVTNTMGCFMCPLFLRIRINENDRFLDLIRYVAKEYGAAHEHHDFGRLLTMENSGKCNENPLLNWIPNDVFSNPGTTLQDFNSTGYFNDLKPTSFEYGIGPNPKTTYDGEPAFALLDTGSGLICRIYYAAGQIPEEQVEELARTFQKFIEVICTDPKTRISTIGLPR